MGVLDDARTVAMGLSAGRVAIGVSAFVTPEFTGRLFGFPKADLNPSAVTLARLFGVREVAIGVANLLWLSSRRPTRTLAALNLAVDGGDAAGGLAGLLGRKGGARANVLTLFVAAPVAAVWARMALSLGNGEEAAGEA
jgi:hypothetical protein